MNIVGVYVVFVVNFIINDIWILVKNRIEVISKCVLDLKLIFNFEFVKIDIYDEVIVFFEIL